MRISHGCGLPFTVVFPRTVVSRQQALRHRLNIIRNMKKNVEWELAEIFTDENLLGTDTRKRREFNYMIEECMAGKINMIITKSLRRFARNLLDCLKYIRQLKNMNIPVLFEKKISILWIPKGRHCWQSWHRWHSRKARM